MNMEASNRRDIGKKSDVAQRYGVTVRTVENWIKNLGLPHLKIGKSVRFIMLDVDAFIKNL